jgi:ATP synthase protein I
MTKDKDIPSLDELDQKISDLRKRNAPKPGRDEAGGEMSAASGAGTGLRIAVDFIAGIAVGVGLGLYLDSQFDTKPWFFILFFILGACAGMLNVIRTAHQLEAREAEAKKMSKTGHK